jgi:hypothetical protein
MFSSLEPRYMRMITAFVMSIGLFLFSSMIYIASGNAEVLSGVTFKMFVVGLIAGGVIATFGAVLFHFAKLGKLDAS